MALGIDFGTTRTVVAFADRGNYPVASFSSDDGETAEWFPSIVAERNGELRFGFDALAVKDDPSWGTARSFKRLLSGPEASTTGTVTVGATTFGVADLVVRFFSSLREALKTRSNLPKALREKDRFEAVVATPANAFCTQRFLTLDAFRKAGFDVKAMLNEPSAAGFEYSHQHARTITSSRAHVVVYDLGGGTFDASLVRMDGKHHDAVLTAGLARLGGDDFDQALYELAVKKGKVKEASLDAFAKARLLDACRDAKEKLNPSSKKLTIDLEACLGEKAPKAELSFPVADYYAAVTPLVEQTLEAMAPVLKRLDGEAPKGGDDELADIAGLYVTGGASALPVIGRILRERFGRRVHRSPYPHAAIAIGLAIAGDSLAGFELTDRFSRNFGVFREAQSGAKASYDPIFTRETPLPRQGEPKKSVSRRYRAQHDVGHYRFFECAAFDDQGTPKGDLAPVTDVFFAFDPELRGKKVDLAKWQVKRLEQAGPIIEEEYAVDAHGIVEITIRDVGSGYVASHRLGSAAS